MACIRSNDDDDPGDTDEHVRNRPPGKIRKWCFDIGDDARNKRNYPSELRRRFNVSQKCISEKSRLNVPKEERTNAIEMVVSANGSPAMLLILKRAMAGTVRS